MSFNFEQLFEQLLKEIDVKELGVFPGKFKPPHKGHFKTCEVACKENDMVLVLISQKSHEGFSPEQSFKIWNIYKKYLTNIIPFITTPTPVLGCYDFANIMNNGEYKASPSSPTPKSNINELVDNSREITSYLNVGNSINLNLYSSQEDASRFKNIFKEPYKGKNVLDIKIKPVQRLTSASKFRDAIKTNKNIDKYLPKELSPEDKENIKNIINETV